jgi:hypothetical protein
MLVQSSVSHSYTATSKHQLYKQLHQGPPTSHPAATAPLGTTGQLCGESATTAAQPSPRRLMSIQRPARETGQAPNHYRLTSILRHRLPREMALFWATWLPVRRKEDMTSPPLLTQAIRYRRGFSRCPWIHWASLCVSMLTTAVNICYSYVGVSSIDIPHLNICYQQFITQLINIPPWKLHILCSPEGIIELICDG